MLILTNVMLPMMRKKMREGLLRLQATYPGKLVLEGRFPQATIDELKRRGHVVEVGGDWSEGRLVAARRDGKVLKAAANPRGMQGYAVGR